MVTTWTGINNANTVGSELVVNGNFTGNANGWTLGQGWSYNVNNVIFDPFEPNPQDLTQNIPSIEEGASYRVSVTAGGTVGAVGVLQWDNNIGEVEAGTTGTFDFIASAIQPGNDFLKISSRETDTGIFDGTVDNVSLKQIGNTAWADIAAASPLSYTNIAKPTDGSTTIFGGQPIGLLMALTYATNIVTPGIWTDISKAAGQLWTNVADNVSSWTDVPKAT